MAQPFELPDLGEGIETGDVVGILVSVGDSIEVDQGIIELETDKALIEVPSSLAGTVSSIEVNQGDAIAPGTVIVTVETNGDASAAPSEAAGPAASPAEATAAAPAPPDPIAAQPTIEPPSVPSAPSSTPAPAASPPASTDGGPIPAAPATRRFARELGVDLHKVSGTGAGGRIVREDVQSYVKGTLVDGSVAQSAGPPPLPDFAKWGEIERQPLAKIRQVIAQNLTTAWTQIPHVTQFGSADTTELEVLRQRNKDAAAAKGARLTPTVLVLKAVITALKAFPNFNASLDPSANELILKRHYHLGIAVDTERGLMVPNIRNVDRKDIYELAIELADIGERARTNKISPDELQGGTFSITNLGSLNGEAFTPIVNYPQAAILGLGRGKEEAVVRDGRIKPRLMMPICVSYDHRVVDGADGVRFLNKIIESLEAPEQMLLGG